MAFGKKSKVSENLGDYSLMLCGESGVGKTTVMSELCEKEFGGDGYLLLNTGDEDGVSAIDGVTYEDVPSFKKFVEICNDIAKNKETDYPNLKVIIADTLDQLIKVTETYAIDTWNRDHAGVKNFKKAKTLNSVEGGFGAGYDIVFNLIFDKIRALEKVGVKFWYTCHSKSKDIVDPITSTAYTTLTSNMPQRYFNDFKTKVHVVGVACIDRKIEEEGTGRENIIDHKEITVNKVKGEKRKIVFRDDSYSVDSKSRFAGIVNEIPLNCKELSKALHDAINSSIGKSTSITKATSVKTKQNKVEDHVVENIVEEIVEDPTEDDIDLPIEEESLVTDDVTETESVYPDDLVGNIRVSFKECTDVSTKKRVKEIIAEYGKLNDVDENGLKRIYDIFNA